LKFTFPYLCLASGYERIHAGDSGPLFLFVSIATVA